MLSQDSEDEFDQDLCLNLWHGLKKLLWQDELNPRVRCAFGNVFFATSNWKPSKSLITTRTDDFHDVFLIFAREHNLVGNWIQFFVIMSKLGLNWAINCPHFLVILTNYLNFPRFVNGKPVNIPGHSVPLAGLGGFILVFGFLAFNGGSQVRFGFNFDCHQFYL